MEQMIKMTDINKEFKILRRHEGIKGSIQDLFSRDYQILKSEVFDIKGVGQFVFGVITVVYSWKKLGILLTFRNVAGCLVGVVSASLFLIAIMNFAAAASFWMAGGTSQLMILMFKFKDYARYPITIFNRAFQIIFTFLIPIGFMAYYPSLYVIRPAEASVLTYLTPLYGIVFVYFSYRVWMKGARQYSGTGS